MNSGTNNYKLYTSSSSISSQLVKLTLEEMGVEMENHEVDLFECQHFEPSFARMNPELSTPFMMNKNECYTDTFTSARDILMYLCNENPKSRMMPIEDENIKKVMYWVDRFFDEWDSIYEFSFYSGND